MAPPGPDVIDAYAVLGVGPDASQSELKAAHRRLVRRHHPDLVGPEHRPATTRRIQEINVAYGLVRDPQARASYDRLLRLHRASSAAAGVDAALADQWEALSVAAGRWAAAWWRASRRRLGRAARRTHRAALGVVGRVLWLLSAAAGGLVGLAVAVAAGGLLGVEGVIAPLTGLLAGGLAGSQRGWHRRLRLAGIPVDPMATTVGTALAAVAVGAALWLESTLG